MNLDNLKAMPLEDIRALANKMNVKYHHKAKPETIAAAIIDQTMTNQQPTNHQMAHQAELPPSKEVHVCSEAEVLEAIKPFADKEGYRAIFPGDGTWIFSYKGAEESGNLAIPLRTIRLKAESVSKGKRMFRAVRGDGTVGKGYADSVLIG